MIIPVFVRRVTEEDASLINTCLTAYNIEYKIYPLQSYRPESILTPNDLWVITFGAQAKTALTGVTKSVVIDLPEPSKLKRDIDENIESRLITHTKLEMLSEILKHHENCLELKNYILVAEIDGDRLEIVDKTSSAKIYITKEEVAKLKDIMSTLQLKQVELHKKEKISGQE